MKQMASRTERCDYDVTQQVGFLIRKANQRHLAIFSELLSGQNLTPAQFTTLCSLRDHGECSQVDLVRATAVDQATIRGVVERLKARGLIALRKGDQDARKILIALTAEGESALDAAIPRARRITDETLKNLSPVERVALSFLLQKISG